MMSRGIATVVVLATLSVLRAGPAAAEVHKVRLDGLQEVPTVSTLATGQLVLNIHNDETQIDYQLTYQGISTHVLFAHIHIGTPGTTGGVVLFLCSNDDLTAPAGTPPCPEGSGTVTGTLTAEDIVPRPAQGIEAGELDEIITMIRGNAAYGNVHSEQSGPGEIRGNLK
jgi:CHRD domain